MKKVFIFIKNIIIPVAIGGIVGIIISKSLDYNNLVKPFLSPPSIVFPIVWTILYIIMGISYSLLEVDLKNDTSINLIYYSQLFVNALWSIFFFSFKWRFFSFIWLLLLIFLVILMIFRFYNKNKVSGLIQVPYLLWSIFALYLNISIYLLNN